MEGGSSLYGVRGDGEEGWKGSSSLYGVKRVEGIGGGGRERERESIHQGWLYIVVVLACNTVGTQQCQEGTWFKSHPLTLAPLSFF